MHSSLTYILTSFALCGGAIAQSINKPVLWSDSVGGLSNHFVFGSSAPTRSFTTKTVSTPSQVLTYAANSGSCGSGHTVACVNITLPDCTALPWTICRCDNAETSLADGLRQFSRVPLHLRDYTRYLTFLSGPGSAYSVSGDTVIFGNSGPETAFPVYIHEFHHNVDGGQVTAGKSSTGFSSTAAWSSAVNGDTCIPDEYASNNLVEDFAQVGVVSVYSDLNSKNPYNGTNVSCMQKQLNYFQAQAALAKNTELNINNNQCDLGIRSKIDVGPAKRMARSIVGAPLPTTVAGMKMKRSSGPRRAAAEE